MLKKKAERMALAPAIKALFEGEAGPNAHGWPRSRSCPPMSIFHDATLAAIAASRPADKQALGQLPGLGTTKLERYGDAILAIVNKA